MVKFRRLENGFGNISKLSGNRRKPFRARKTIGYNENGNQLYETVGYYKSYTDAFEALVEYNNNPYDLNKKDVTLKGVADLWFSIQKEKMQYNSYRAYERAYEKFNDIYQNKKFKDIKSMELQIIMDTIETKTGKVKFKGLLNNLYKFSNKMDMALINQAELLEITDGTHNKVVKNEFTKEEILNVFKNEKQTQLNDVVTILLFTGFRANELLTLKKENILLDKNIIIGGFKTPTGTDRTVPISRHIKPILERYINNGKEHMFYNKYDNQFTYLNLKTQIKDTFNHTAHECRHTFTSNFYRTEANKITIKKIVGHKDKDLTENVYVHRTDEELIRAMGLFDDYMETILCH